jgi:hypothetical protein
LTATKNIDTAASVDITASNNSVSSSTLNVGYGVANYAVVPVTATYFDMNANNEILGFSSAVVNDPSLLNSYNCLDLNNRVIA